MPRSVADYYDNNTRRFVGRGQNAGTGNIHQPLWAPGVRTLEQAVNHANDLVLRELRRIEQEAPGAEFEVLDLGCGVGATLFYLASALPETVSFRGISISKQQIQLAKQRSEGRARKERITFLHGDFEALPPLPPVHLAFAIEAFVHARDPAAFFAQVASILAPGGVLVIVDDIRAACPNPPLSGQEEAWLADFQRGWMATSLRTEEQIRKLAKAVGLRLRTSEDLTPHMRVGRLRDKLIGVARLLAGRYMRRSLYLQALSGGYAKQQCLKRGLVQYRQLIFERVPEVRATAQAPAR